MDRKLSTNPEIERLIRTSDRARAQLSGEVVSLKRRLDVPARLKGSVKKHTSGWLLGSLASGLVASLLFRRKPSVASKKPRSFPLAIAGLILTVVRPFVKVWAVDQLKHYISGQPPVHPVTRPVRSSTPF